LTSRKKPSVNRALYKPPISAREGVLKRSDKLTRSRQSSEDGRAEHADNEEVEDRGVSARETHHTGLTGPATRMGSLDQHRDKLSIERIKESGTSGM
jgi:hypothetical protein